MARDEASCDAAVPDDGTAAVETADPRIRRRRPVQLHRADGTPLPDGERAALVALLDSFPDAAMLITESHHIALANATSLHHLQRSQSGLCGEYCPRVVHGRDTPFPGCPLEASIRTGEVTDSELRETEGDRWVRAVISPTPFLDQMGQR